MFDINEEKGERSVNLLQVRFDSLDDSARTFSGYANVFNVVDDYGTAFAPGAFAASLADWKAQGRMPKMFFNHDHYSIPPGVWTDAEEDDYGLRVTGTLFDTADGNALYLALKAGAVDGLSVGFNPREYRIVENTPGHFATFTQADLVEVSIVNWPSNDPSRIDEVRTMIEDGMSVRELEAYLKKLGVSRSAATAIASQFESKTELKRLADEKAMLNAMDAFIRAAR